MQKVIHRAEHRGAVNLGWLRSWHSFSFGQWYNPEKIHFGALRVLNDDIIAGGLGFGTHPHDNMEIVTIPLSGALHHRDSTGRDEVIRAGEVQMMSAGSGISHSEHNHHRQEEVSLLQIWVFPKIRNIEPTYQQSVFETADRQNCWQVVVSPEARGAALVINQDAYFSLCDLTANNNIEYHINKEGNGVYFFVIEGEIELAGETLLRRDAIGISEIETLSIFAKADTKLLAIEVPMAF